MARADGLLGLALTAALLGTAGIARAASPCEEGREQTGLALAPAASGLAVAVVDADSVAAARGFQAGDAVVQVNGVVVRNCGEYARAVHDARKERKALLVLLRRDGAETAAVLAASTWERAVAAAPLRPLPAAEPPSVRPLVEKPRPAPLPPAAHVSVDEVLRGLDALAPEADGRRARLVDYRRALGRVQRQLETLAVRAAAPPDVLGGLRTVLRYYEAVGVAWESSDAQRERERHPRHLPEPEGATAPFFAESEIANAIDEFPFLRETVVREPRPALVVGESAGLWRPRAARRLLLAHGREELARLSAWLAAGAS
jgi:hypothetical protein